MDLIGFDHIVLCVSDVATSLAFYERALGMTPREERPGKWSLHFGSNKISLQDSATVPEIARNTTPGSGNFCILTRTPIAEAAEHLKDIGVNLVDGPGERVGSTGPILSIYFNDPDGNLVEISNAL